MTQLLRAAITPLWHHSLTPQTAIPHRHRHLHLQSRGLRLPRDTDLNSNQSNDPDNKRKTRNEMKRDARASVRWGMDLASFSTPQIKRILNAFALEEEVFEALMLVKRLGPDVREGKRRQFNYIGKLLRDAQPELLGALIQATKDGDQSRFQALACCAGSIDDDDGEEEFQESESEIEDEDAAGEHLLLASRWYEGLINRDIQISNEVYSVDDVEFDRQELRRLVRKVHYVQDCSDDITSAELTAAKKSLNLFLASLAKRLRVSTTVQNVLL